jgi:hypothetical protein
MEAHKEFKAALDAYGVARQTDDPEDRYQGTLGALRIYEKGQFPTHPLKVLGVLMLVLTIVGGLALIFPALPKAGTYGSPRVPFNEVRLSIGIAATFSGLIWSALLIAAARVVRLFETMDLRQAAEREARMRGEVGMPKIAPLETPIPRESAAA